MKDFDYLTKLAALRIKPQDKEALSKEIDKMINYFEELKQVKTDGVSPLISSVFFVSPMFLREDEPSSFSEVDSILQSFSVKEGAYLKTPPVEEIEL